MADELKTLIVDRASNSASTVARTILVALAPWKIVLVRALRSYLQSLGGLLTVTGSPIGAAVGLTLEAPDFVTWFLKCASIALAPAVISVIQNTLELLKKVDETNPGFRG